MTTTTDDYAIAGDVEGTQVFRSATTAQDPPAFTARCRCGFRNGPHRDVRSAEAARDVHADACLWPKP